VSNDFFSNQPIGHGVVLLVFGLIILGHSWNSMSWTCLTTSVQITRCSLCV